MFVKRWMILWLVNRALAGTRWFGLKRRLLNALGHSLGAGTRVVGPVHCTGRLVAGQNCWIGRDLTIHGNGTVRLGDRCDLAPEVRFFTGSHAIGGEDRRAGAGKTVTIEIGDGCWIGGGSSFLNEIRVGRGCVIGACACVVKDIPENTLAAGVPARVLRRL